MSAFCAAMFLGFAVVTLRDALSIDGGWLLARGTVLIVMATSVGLLLARDRWSLAQLRVVQTVVFATATGYFAARAYAVGFADLSAGSGGWSDTLLGFGLLMIAFGIFVPNPLPRAVVGIVAIAATPVVAAFVYRANNPDVRPAFDVAVSNRMFETALTAATGGAVAIFAAFFTFTLFNFAFEQRKRTFYDLEKRIGSGGMGEVWLAHHRSLHRPTAVKLIREDRIDADDDEEVLRVLRRFEREAKATAGLRSPHTIDVYDFGVTEDGHFFYAMEYLDGLDLEALIERFGPVPAERAVHFLLQACDSLADAHDNGLTHRDIKPANLFLSRLGPSCDYVKLLDFGLVQDANPVDDAEKLTAEGTTAGTPAYMAPEMAVERDGADNRSDIYALGCVAYWLITGKQVFEAETGVALIVEHVKTEPKPPSQRTELPIPAELEAIVLKCLAKDPSDRFQTTAEMTAALNAVPLSQRWTRARADEWWRVHLPVAADAA